MSPDAPSYPDVVRTRGDAVGPVEPVLVLDVVEQILDRHGLGSGPVEATPIGDGHSNFTFLLRRGVDAWVLRRPPRPPFPPSAHDVLREFRVLSGCGNGVRVPDVVFAHEDPKDIGAPFYVMRFVPGVVLTETLDPRFASPEDRARIGDDVVDALVEIHALDWKASGLEGLGREHGYLTRQMRTFRGVWGRVCAREVPQVLELADRLEATMPVSGPATLVHGDYRLGNVMFGPQSPARIEAVLDWEMATIGDPLADLGWLVANWAIPGDSDGALLSLNAATDGPGFAGRQQLVERYATRSGRSVCRIDWYAAFAQWRAAVFMEASFRRWQDGTANDPFFASLERGVPDLAARALAALERDAARPSTPEGARS